MEKDNKGLNSLLTKNITKKLVKKEVEKIEKTSCIIRRDTLAILKDIKSEIEYKRRKKDKSKDNTYTNHDILHDAILLLAKKHGIDF